MTQDEEENNLSSKVEGCSVLMSYEVNRPDT